MLTDAETLELIHEVSVYVAKYQVKAKDALGLLTVYELW